jgi:pyruvate dehydrogenase E2 component (dihydrolipoamide acetyltransferase)
MTSLITPIVMPKWGLSMEEGVVERWLVDEGSAVEAGMEIAEVETDKITGMIEAPVKGVLRRKVAAERATLRCGALMGVIADASVAEAEIDEFIGSFVAAPDAGEASQ